MSTVISAAVSDELAERIDEHREGEGDERESRSKAVDRLIRAGLEAEESTETVPLRLYIAWFGSLLVIAPLTEPAGVSPAMLIVTGIALVVGSLGYPYAVQRFRD